MIIFIILLSCLITASLGDDLSPSSYSYDYSDDISDSSSIEERILGGSLLTVSDLKKFKYMVGIYNVQKNLPGHTCGAVLVHERVVLTAAHCLLDTKFVSVFTGTVILKTNPYAATAIRVYPGDIVVHPEYSTMPTRHDIGLLILPTPARMDEDYVGTIPLASYRWTNCSTGSGWVAGWGETEDGSISKILKSANVAPMLPEDCLASHGTFMPEQQLCSSGESGQGTCRGDSGGPYALESAEGSHYLCGINSYILFGGICNNSKPKFYTSVAYYNDNNWICESSRGLVGCES